MISSVVYKKSGVRNNQLLLKGTLIPVEDILEHLALGWSIEQLEELFPSIKKEYVSRLLKDIAKEYKGK